MKSIKIIVAIVVMGFVLFSCSKEENDLVNETVNELSESDLEKVAQEEAIIPVEDITLTITGAEIKTEALNPNGAIAMTVPDEKALAFSDEGFTVKLNSTDDFEGIYLQLKGATEYLDIPRSSLTSTAFKSSKKTSSKKKSNLFSRMSKTATEEGSSLELSVNFGEAIQPGTFCYTVCIYDGNGNISAPQEVCVTVKSFGGLSKLVGTWNFIKGGEGGKEYLPGSQFCEFYNDDCPSNPEIHKILKDCYSLPQSIVLEFNGDGAYRTVLRFSTLNTVDRFDTECEVFTEVGERSPEVISESKGKWAFDNGNLILINYSYVKFDKEGRVQIEMITEEGQASWGVHKVEITDNLFTWFIDAGWDLDKHYYSK